MKINVLVVYCIAIFVSVCLFGIPCFGQDVGEGITGARANQPGLTPPDMNFDPGPLKVVDSEWMNNRIGLDNSVPAPWTPLKRNGNTVSCWDRTYTFDGAFLSKLHGNSRDLLSRPMQMVAKIDGKNFHLTDLQTQFISEKGDRIEFTATGDLGPIKLRATNWIEFDGMVQVKFDLDAGSGVDVEYLRLEIPMPSDVAKYYFFCNGEWGNKPLGAIGTDVGWKWGTQWWPICWVGDENRGLTFVVESGDGWQMTPEGNSHEFIREKDEVLWQVHILGKPKRMTGVNSYLVGLQATPMKPMRKDMAAYNPAMGVWSGGPKYFGNMHRNQFPDRLMSIYPDTDKGVREFEDLGVNSINMWFQTRWVCFPEYRNPENIKKAIAKWHKAGMSVVQYWSTYFQGYESDVYKRNWKEWAHLRPNGDFYSTGYNTISDGNIGMVTCCPRSSFGDFMVWGVDYLMRTYGIDGLGYVDAPGPFYCYNKSHGCDGGYPVFRDREIFKRWWKIVKKYKPNGYIWAHASEAFCSPIMAYMDAYITGEEFRTTVRPLSDLDKTRLAVTMTGLQWGSQPMWMYQCSGGGIHRENTMWASSRILPYGATPVLGWADASLITPVMKAKMKFGVDKKDTKFYAPHQLPNWFKINSPNLVTGCWQRADGNVLLIISNFENDYKDAEIEGAPFEKNGKFAIAHDALTGARLATYNNTFGMCIPANSFRVIIIQPGKESPKEN